MKKKRAFFTTLLLGGLIMIGLAGCGENKTVENGLKIKSLRLVVSIQQNLFDLFKQFPKGFNITQTFYKDSLRTVCFLRWR